MSHAPAYPPEFDRTTCACERCVKCCKTKPGPLAPGDFERIVAYKAETQKLSLEDAFQEAKKQFVASPGALVVRFLFNESGMVGTITPKSKKGRCVFLDANDRCSIHPVAPFGCAYFDMHQPDTEIQPRADWLARAQRHPDYQALRDSLPLCENYVNERNKRL